MDPTGDTFNGTNYKGTMKVLQMEGRLRSTLRKPPFHSAAEAALSPRTSHNKHNKGGRWFLRSRKAREEVSVYAECRWPLYLRGLSIRRHTSAEARGHTRQQTHVHAHIHRHWPKIWLSISLLRVPCSRNPAPGKRLEVALLKKSYQVPRDCIAIAVLSPKHKKHHKRDTSATFWFCASRDNSSPTGCVFSVTT